MRSLEESAARLSSLSPSLVQTPAHRTAPTKDWPWPWPGACLRQGTYTPEAGKAPYDSKLLFCIVLQDGDVVAAS